MTCDSCGYTEAVGIRIGYTDAGVKWEVCDRCSDARFQAMPDVYLGSKGGIQTDEHLCGSDGKPMPFSTKREKAAIMKHLGIRQAANAERHHGARNEAITRKKYFI